MGDQKELLFVNHYLPGNEHTLVDKFREVSTRRNTQSLEVSKALKDISIDDVSDIVVGPQHIGFLFVDGRVARLSYSATTRSLPACASNANQVKTSSISLSTGGSSIPTVPPPSSSNSASLVSRTAKFRRVMLTTSSRRGERAGVIVDRARPMLPASAVPEDLIAQAQVVLQGKSREMIVRELQRTNLNVNEAVNNLLSRDDDDDEGSEGGGSEVCLPEELLSLLETSHGSLLDSDLYGGDSFDYLLSSRERRRNEKDKEKGGKGKVSSDSVSSDGVRRFEISQDSYLEWWDGDCKIAAGANSKLFSQIASTNSELLAVGKDGKLYGWEWKKERGDDEEHAMMVHIGKNEGETIVELSACSLRVAVFTSEKRVATWMDHVACGQRLSQALLVPLSRLPGLNDEKEHPEELVVSNQMAVVRCSPHVFYWCGLYPVAERRRIFEKARSRLRKHVTFDTTQIMEGSEVRTKSGPIYSQGCVAVNLSGNTPSVGVLMENAWSLSEMCRFRVLDPATYDEDIPVENNDEMTNREEDEERRVAQEALASGNRKRAATDDIFTTPTVVHREEAWPIAEVIFIHEESPSDTAVVKIVDGGYCALEYQSAPKSKTEAFSTASGQRLVEGTSKPSSKMRLIRKDELTVVNERVRNARSPTCIKKEPTRFVLRGSITTKKAVSVVADSLGIRVLMERRGSGVNGSMTWMVRASVGGKTLSVHPLPIHPSAIYPNEQNGKHKLPKLINYGDDMLLILNDGYGALTPLIRDAAAGFKEPSFLYLPAAAISAVGITQLSEKDKPSSHPKANREAIIVSLVGTSSATIQRRLPSLMQCILYCDEKAVKGVLDRLAEEEDERLARREIAESRCDGGRNIIHTAVMQAFAMKNSEEADVEPLPELSPQETKSVADYQKAFDHRWQMMLRQKKSAQGTTTVEGGTQTEEAMEVSTTVVIKQEEDDRSLVVNATPVENGKTRQGNAIEIVKILVNHPIMMPYLSTLLSERDVHGVTPFMSAVSLRAYSAARHILTAILGLFVDIEKDKIAPQLFNFIFPVGCRADDSPLFVLCYNDTCSFTWTGEEHINQDIFECRTCGLTGSLCCCTECAYTCHRNHECRLKRTSPTAYCDCWEKSCCKALVAGNQAAREKLLQELIAYSSLYTKTNARGEHIVLFLARKLARQSSEQANQQKRRGRLGGAVGGGRDSANVPEHDLEPPKFARTALLLCFSDWEVIKSIAMIGVRSLHGDQHVVEDVFHLNAQHGSTHLDKLMFILLTKCHDQMPQLLEKLMSVLAEQSNEARKTGKNLEEVNWVIGRLIRSVARIYLAAIVLSPSAAAAAITGVAPQKESADKTIRAMSLTGFFSIVRSRESANSKDSKQRAMASLIVRCRSVFAHFAIYSLHEMSQLADALLAPVRTGVVRPSAFINSIYATGADNLEILEKYFNGESDLTTTMAKTESCNVIDHTRPKRRRGTSRRETDREEPIARNEGGREETVAVQERESSAESDAYSDSDSDGDVPSSRRLTSQSSAMATQEEEQPGGGGEERKNRKVARVSTSRREEEDDGWRESSEDDDDSEGERDEDDEEEDDDDDDEQDMEEDDDGRTYVVTEAEREGMDYSPASPQYALSDEEEGGGRDDEESSRRKTDEGEEETDQGDVAMEEEPSDDQGESRDGPSRDAPEEGAHDTIDEDKPASAGTSTVVATSAAPGGGEEGGDGRRERRRDRPGTARGNRTSSSTSNASSLREAANEIENRMRERRNGGSGYSSGWSLRRIPSTASTTWRRNGDINEEGSSSRRREDETTLTSIGGNTADRSTYLDRTSVNNNSEGGTTTTERREGTKEEDIPSALKTSIQLATAFSFAVRLLNELIIQIVQPGDEEVSEKTQSLKQCDPPSEALRKRTLAELQSRLDDSWRWVTVVLDQSEAQMKYGNAVLANSGGHDMGEEKRDARKDAKEKKKNKRSERSISSSARDETTGYCTHSCCTGRKETFEVLFSVMRSLSGEDGDEMPPIDVESLKPAALVVDAYLSFVQTIAKMENVQEGEQMEELKKKKETISDIRRFYQRSNSLSYPGVSFSDAHDTLSTPCTSSLPIVERPHLLTPSAERETIFGAPALHRTTAQHDEVMKWHGLPHAHNQSLTAAAVPIHKVFEEAHEGNVAMVSAASAPAKLNERGSDKKKEKRGRRSKKDKEEKVEVVEVSPPQGFQRMSLEEIRKEFEAYKENKVQKYIGRWRFSLQMMAKEFHADLLATFGGEMGGSTLLSQLAAFHVKQSQFRRRMDKFRNTITKDIALEIHRDPSSLLRDTVFQLNKMYMRRVAQSGPRGGKGEEKIPPLAAHKVKVKFHDEPGEGTGVARSFYTAMAEALHSLKQFPFTDFGWNSINDDYLYGGPTTLTPSAPPSADRTVSSSGGTRRIVVRGRDTIFATRRKIVGRRLTLNLLHPPYTPDDITAAETLPDSADSVMEAEMELRVPPPPTDEGSNTATIANMRLPKQFLDRLFIKVRALQPTAAARITGMLVDVPLSSAVVMLTDPSMLRGYVSDAVDLMVNGGSPSDLSLLKTNEENEKKEEEGEASGCSSPQEADDAPLFFRTCRRAHFSPVPGRLSPMRLSAFRNIGRIMGLCISQCELFPLRVSRHVLKFILDRPLNWHDFAFFDPQMFESLRQMIVEGHSTEKGDEYFEDLMIPFAVEVPAEAAGKDNLTIELIPNGNNVFVNKDNVCEYVYRYVEARLLGHNTKCLESIRKGVLDVVPLSMLNTLTAEELRLILCGTETVSMSLMQSYTTWTDESHASPETINRFKNWFWQVADRFSNQEKQDLIFFWTGSPSLPSSEEGFQPMPTIVIRPADDGFLPTANTCISRLYLPLYPSKKILTSKLQLAIKAKNFGFV